MGQSETRIFFQICAPVSLPGIATISLFTALGFWNDWFNAHSSISKVTTFTPLQYLLMQIQNNMDYIAKNVEIYPANWQELYNPSHGKQDVWPWWSAAVPIAILYYILPTLLWKAWPSVVWRKGNIVHRKSARFSTHNSLKKKIT